MILPDHNRERNVFLQDALGVMRKEGGPKFHPTILAEVRAREAQHCTLGHP